MYYAMRASAPSLHRESTDSLIKDEDVQYRKGRYIRGEIIGASLLVKDRGDNKISKFLAI